MCVCSYLGIELLFLVGGFSESAVLQAHIRQQFGQRLKIAIPQDASLAILKGILPLIGGVWLGDLGATILPSPVSSRLVSTLQPISSSLQHPHPFLPHLTLLLPFSSISRTPFTSFPYLPCGRFLNNIVNFGPFQQTVELNVKVHKNCTCHCRF